MSLAGSTSASTSVSPTTREPWPNWSPSFNRAWMRSTNSAHQSLLRAPTPIPRPVHLPSPLQWFRQSLGPQGQRSTLAGTPIPGSWQPCDGGTERNGLAMFTTNRPLPLHDRADAAGETKQCDRNDEFLL